MPHLSLWELLWNRCLCKFISCLCFSFSMAEVDLGFMVFLRVHFPVLLSYMLSWIFVVLWVAYLNNFNTYSYNTPREFFLSIPFLLKNFEFKCTVCPAVICKGLWSSYWRSLPGMYNPTWQRMEKSVWQLLGTPLNST